MKLNCLSLGNPYGRPLVFLHGLFGSGKDFSPLNELEKIYQCHYFDLPGHGNTLNADFKSFDEFGHSFFESLKNFEQKPFLVGYSLGGRIALFLMSHYSHHFEKAAIFSAHPGIIDPKERQERLDQDLTLLENIEDQELFFKNWYASPLFGKLKDNPNFNKLIKERKNCDLEKIKKCMHFLSVGSQSPLWENLALLNKPLFLGSGALDKKYNNFYQLLTYNPLFSFQSYLNCGHNPIFEMPDQIIKSLTYFFR